MYCQKCGFQNSDEASFCGGCGSATQSSRSAIADDNPARCPVCLDISSSAKLGVVIDSSKSSGLGAGIGTGGVGVGGGISNTQLHERLRPPPRPSASTGCYWILTAPLTLIGIAIISGFATIGGEGGFLTGWIGGLILGFVPAIFIGLIFAMITKSTTRPYYEAAGKDWDAKNATYRNAYYCSRDDIVFDGASQAKPEVFKQSVFTPFEKNKPAK